MDGLVAKAWQRAAPGAALAALLLFFGRTPFAADMGGGSPGHGHEGHGAVSHEPGFRPGDVVYAGPLGPWSAEVRLIDMRAEMAKAKVSAKAMAMVTHTHHVLLYLTGAGGKSEDVKALRGTVTVAGPKTERSRAELIAMGDHIGADLTLPGPGTYEMRVEIQVGDRMGSASFTCSVEGP